MFYTNARHNGTSAVEERTSKAIGKTWGKHEKQKHASWCSDVSGCQKLEKGNEYTFKYFRYVLRTTLNSIASHPNRMIIDASCRTPHFHHTSLLHKVVVWNLIVSKYDI